MQKLVLTVGIQRNKNVRARTHTHTHTQTESEKSSEFLNMTVKPDSLIACRAHAVPLPCRAAKGLECVFSPFDLHSAAVSDSHLPCHAHAMLRPCRSSQGHSTAQPSLDGRAVLLQGNGMGAAWERHAMCESAFAVVRAAFLDSSQESKFISRS